MKLYYCQTPKPNFGDELNPWMWPRLLPDMFDDDNQELFLGIGSVLFDYFPTSSRKVVFGAGYGGYTPAPQLDAGWKIYFVRGHLTADMLGVDRSLALGDAAILLRSCVAARPQKKFPVSFMPHWESAVFGDWPAVCERAAIHYIDPCASVESVLHDILASDRIISEAMHGAIVADALRVPWLAMQPIRRRNRMKWLDWASALGITLDPRNVGPSNAFELCVAWLDAHPLWSRRLERRGLVLRRLGRELFIDRSASRLARIARMTPSLSADSAIEQAHSAMLDKLEDFRRDFHQAGGSSKTPYGKALRVK